MSHDTALPEPIGDTADQRFVPLDAVVPSAEATGAGPDIIWTLDPPSAQTPRQIVKEKTDRSHRLDVNLRRVIGYFTFVAVLLELVLANALFVYYAWWRPEREGAAPVAPMVVALWYAAVVVQVVGMLFVATRGGAPKRGAR